MSCKWHDMERRGVIGFGLFIAVLWVGNLIYRFCTDTWLQFFELQLSSLISITLAFLIAYVFSQKQTDFRKKKDVISDIVNRIIADLSDVRMYSISSKEDIQFVLMKYRSLDNRVKLIKKFEADFDIKTDMEYINDKLEEYWTFVSNHVSDTEYLAKSQNELQSFVQNITNKLESIVVEINMS